MSISVETLALAKKNTKQAVEEAVTSVYRYRGSVETFEDLPTSGQKVGDVYNVVQKAGQNYAWDGEHWEALGIADNLGDIEFEGLGETEVEVSFDGNNDRVTYNEYTEMSKAIPLENLTSNQILISCDGKEDPSSYLGFSFSNSINSIDLYSGPGNLLQNIGNNQYIYTIPDGYGAYEYFFLPLTYEKYGPQGSSLGKTEYFINPVIEYKALEQGMVTKTINQNFDDSDKVDEKVQIAKNMANAAYNQGNSAYNQANAAYNKANEAYSKANNAYSYASTAYTKASSASNIANNAYNAANNAYNAANVANNSLNDLGNIEFSNSSIITTVTKDLTNDKTTTWGIPIRAREVKDGKITIKVTNNQDVPAVQYPSAFSGGYGPTPQQAVGGPGGSYTPSISSNVDEYIYTIDSSVIQNDYYIFIDNAVKNMGQSTGFSFQGTLSYETETAGETKTINNDFYDKEDVNNLISNTSNIANDAYSLASNASNSAANAANLAGAAAVTYFGTDSNHRIDRTGQYANIKKGDLYILTVNYQSIVKVVDDVYNGTGNSYFTVKPVDNTIVSSNSRPNDMPSYDYTMIDIGAVWVDTTHHKVSILEDQVGAAPNTEFIWNDLPTQASVETDATNTTIDLTLEDNHEYRYTSDVESLTLTMPSGEFLSTVVFQSGTNATQMTYDSGIKWTGDDVVSGAFVPQANKVYDLVFWYNGININGISRGV